MEPRQSHKFLCILWGLAGYVTLLCLPTEYATTRGIWMFPSILELNHSFSAQSHVLFERAIPQDKICSLYVFYALKIIVHAYKRYVDEPAIP